MDTHQMTSHQPATRWQDAFPAGNGTIGALVAGAIAHELVVLNHDRLWLRSPEPSVPDIAEYLPTVRRLLAEGKPGSLINITSQMAHVGGVDRAVYAATKHAVEGMTKSMAIEWGPHGIRVNTIAPTFIRTALTAATFANLDACPIVRKIPKPTAEPCKFVCARSSAS